ncbi:HAD family hydrolase [Halalkalibacillus halophilus]|uniref:HAD family hydrolase n=1 Tax=Halalkalibacillus halophilus TaxID=392827 RepID=UPI000405CA00|nr:HAD family hydrolase [Halalkalibacillus halophilus]
MAVVTVDFDGTLYQGNSFKVMFKVAKQEYGIKQWSIVGFGVVKSVILGIFKGKEAFKHQFFRSFVRSMKGKSKEELQEFFTVLAQNDLEKVNEPLVKKVKEHRANGDDVVVLSGALIPFLHAFVREVDLEDVDTIGTQLEYDSNNICTGRMSKIVNGDEKVNQITQWLKRNNKKKDSETLYAYADSDTDMPLLHMVDHPVVVNPDEDMKKAAKDNHWQIFQG